MAAGGGRGAAVHPGVDMAMNIGRWPWCWCYIVDSYRIIVFYGIITDK